MTEKMSRWRCHHTFRCHHTVPKPCYIRSWACPSSGIWPCELAAIPWCHGQVWCWAAGSAGWKGEDTVWEMGKCRDLCAGISCRELPQCHAEIFQLQVLPPFIPHVGNIPSDGTSLSKHVVCWPAQTGCSPFLAPEGKAREMCCQSKSFHDLPTFQINWRSINKHNGNSFPIPSPSASL